MVIGRTCHPWSFQLRNAHSGRSSERLTPFAGPERHGPDCRAEGRDFLCPPGTQKTRSKRDDSSHRCDRHGGLSHR